MNTTCVVCNSKSGHKTVFNEFGIDILRCGRCGHVFSSYVNDQHYDGYFAYDPLSVKEMKTYWDDAHRAMYTGFHERFVRGKKGKMLDAGCGLGYFVKMMGEMAPGWEIHGCETSKSAVEFSKKELGLATVRCGRIEELAAGKESFDIITLWDVIEHIPDCNPFLSSLHSLLKKGGILFLHTPNVAIQIPKAKLKALLKGMKPGEHYLEAKDHVNLYSMRSLTRVLNRAGFNKVRFTHLEPIHSVAGADGKAAVTAKRLWYLASSFLHTASLGRLNLDNLFAVAEK